MILRLIFLCLLLPWSIVYSGEHDDHIVPEYTILVVGDSLSAAYGFEVNKGWVNLLRIRLDNYDSSSRWSVVNASISGDTTSGGLVRLPGLLEKHNPVLCMIALGANDGLRGQPIDLIYNNLNTMVRSCNQSATTLLVGIKLPPNYGELYTRAFHDVYTRVARDNEIPLVPFMLEDMALRDDLFQSDRLHPTAEAQPIILENIWMVLENKIPHIAQQNKKIDNHQYWH